jgi:hypothetical protein
VYKKTQDLTQISNPLKNYQKSYLEKVRGPRTFARSAQKLKAQKFPYFYANRSQSMFSEEKKLEFLLPRYKLERKKERKKERIFIYLSQCTQQLHYISAPC